MIALDGMNSLKEIEDWVSRLKGKAGAFKLGLQSFTRFGPESVALVNSLGAQIFLDLKFHDIPNTVAGAVKEAAGMKVKMMNLHASGGFAMMNAAKKALDETGRHDRPWLIAVTVLTSIDDDVMRMELGLDYSSKEYVKKMALLAKKAGLDGVVASPKEIKTVRKACGDDFVIVTPGIRPAWSAANDQKRIAAPGDAVRDGADFLVIGRAVTKPPSGMTPEESLERITDEIREAVDG